MKTFLLPILLFFVTGSVFAQKAKVQFDDLTIELSSLEVFDHSEIRGKTFSSSATVSIQAGEVVEVSTIKVSNSKLKDLEMELCFETSITIMNEGPHCDLTDWKHHTSKWVKLKRAGSSSFQMRSFASYETERFPKVSMAELVKEVEKQCPNMVSVAKKATSIHKYPCGVYLSRYFLKIKGHDESGETVERTVIFEIPFGC